MPGSLTVEDTAFLSEVIKKSRCFAKLYLNLDLSLYDFTGYSLFSQFPLTFQY